MRCSIRLGLLLGLLPALLLPGLVHAQEARDFTAEIEAATKLLEKYAAGETDEDKQWAAAVQERLARLKELVATREQVAKLPDLDSIEKDGK